MRHGTVGDRGAALVIALLVVSIVVFLGGTILLMSQGEMQISATMRQSSAAFSAAEAGIETIFNQLPRKDAVSCGKLTAGCDDLQFYSGKKTDATAQPITGLGPQQASPGYNLDNTAWNGYWVFATGMSTTFYVWVNQVTELEIQTTVGQICRSTSYDC